MTIEPPAPGESRRPLGPRDPGDAWVVAPTGERYWGRFGASGLLALDADRGVLLQHRVSWSHFGDTWALPGGARHEGESATDGALREAAEEAGVPDAAIRPRLLSVLDLGYWSYTTLVGDVVRPFEPTISDPESRELAWVAVDAVDDRPLHPGFAASWALLRPALDIRPAVVVDVANVMGSVPDGWWKDRAGAADRLIGRVGVLAAAGVPAEALELPEHTWYPEWIAVVEGQARGAGAAANKDVEVVAAPASGDDAIVAEATRLVAAGRTVTVVTSDRELVRRVTDVGAAVARCPMAARPVGLSAVTPRGRGASRCRAARVWSGARRRGRAPERMRSAPAGVGEACDHRPPWRPATAPTRFEIGSRTMRIRSNPWMRTRSSSPGRTGCAALARSPFTRTCPARHAVVAAERVLYTRTAQSHASTRAEASVMTSPLPFRRT